MNENKDLKEEVEDKNNALFELAQFYEVNFNYNFFSIVKKIILIKSIMGKKI